MGLDQYLKRNTYVKNWDHFQPEEVWEVTAKQGGEEVELENVMYIVEEVHYWRKCNAIHKYFVENVQDGVDDCGEYYVPHDVLRDLRDKCEDVVDLLEYDGYTTEKKNEMLDSLLPPQSGFFFGSTEYDEWYHNDIQDTLEMLNKILNRDKIGEIYYNSSW